MADNRPATLSSSYPSVSLKPDTKFRQRGKDGSSATCRWRNVSLPINETHDLGDTTQGAYMIRPQKVGHVVLKVRALQRAERFFTEVLGVEVVTRLKNPHAVFFTLGEQHHDLAVLEVPADGPETRDQQV